MVLSQKEFVDELKVEWKKLWRERLDDKVRAEGIAINNYDSLFVDKGTIIHATRDFKALNFKDILEQHAVQNPERYILPNKQVGGWGKFARDNLRKEPMTKTTPVNKRGKKIQQKHSGRGWLNI
jgi:hypothetical protein